MIVNICRSLRKLEHLIVTNKQLINLWILIIGGEYHAPIVWIYSPCDIENLAVWDEL